MTDDPGMTTTQTTTDPRTIAGTKVDVTIGKWGGRTGTILNFVPERTNPVAVILDDVAYGPNGTVCCKLDEVAVAS